MQTHDHHCLSLEFPELKSEIHRLKVEDAHFRRLHEEYTEVSKQIEHMQAEIVPSTTSAEEALKAQRVHLKDSLYQMLTAAAG